MAFGQSPAVVRQLAPTVKKPIAQGLVDGDCSPWSVQVQWPWGSDRRFRRIVHTERYAERALIAVGVFLEPSSRLVGGHVHIRRLDGLAHQHAYNPGEL